MTFYDIDFILIILELSPADTLFKLYRSNKYIRGIIQENNKYLVMISEFKYQTVSQKYESLMKGKIAIL